MGLVSKALTLAKPRASESAKELASEFYSRTATSFVDILKPSARVVWHRSKPQNLTLLLQDASKAVIKKHNSLVLRAESPAEKYSWLLRLKRCAEGPGAYVAPPPRGGAPERSLASTPGGGKKSAASGALVPSYQQVRQR